jgi:hypothetical protein
MKGIRSSRKEEVGYIEGSREEAGRTAVVVGSNFVD